MILDAAPGITTLPGSLLSGVGGGYQTLFVSQRIDDMSLQKDRPMVIQTF
jgi:hypothetical protein